MSKLNRAAQEFIQSYEKRYETTKKAAELASEMVERYLQDAGVFVQIISSRAKSLDSLREKLRRKQYKNPTKELKDLIGIRIICYYSDTIDEVISKLRQEFEINKKESVDKRNISGKDSYFGYKSVHLIVRLKKGQALSIDHLPLRESWFEIQIRSILEHAWAEIEHKVVYKSGIKYTNNVTRRFARLAGSLELLDSEFLALRGERDQLIKAYCDKYLLGKEGGEEFDVARLLGFLQATLPSGQEGTIPLGTGFQVSCVDALKEVGLGTAKSLRRIFRSRKFRYALTSFASEQGIAPDEVSHLAVVVIAVAIKNAFIVKRHFPEMIYDPAIANIIKRRVRIIK